MLELLNSHAHGYLSIPLIDRCRQAGLFALFQDDIGYTLEEISSALSGNTGNIAVALRLLCSLGWVECRHDKYYLMSPMYNSIPSDVMVLCDFPIDQYLLQQDVVDEKALSLDAWIQLSKQSWLIDDPTIIDYLDGVLIVPLLLALKQHHLILSFAEGHYYFSKALLSAIQAEIFDLFQSKRWVTGTPAQFAWTPTGQFLWERAFNHAALVSYRPMRSRLDDLLFGQVDVVFQRDDVGHELHVDRTLNVIGSGFQHEHYFRDLTYALHAVFDRLPCHEQPKYIIDMGCGDGTLLKRTYDYIQQNTVRGQHLDTFPLTVIGVDYNGEALFETEKTLTDLPHRTLRGDINDPEQLLVDLSAVGIANPDEILHVRSFLDHERPHRPEAYACQDVPDSMLSLSGVYVDQTGQLIDPVYIFRELVTHFLRWRKIIGKYGLLVLEVHYLPADIVSRYLNQCENLHFDAYHALSRQFLIEAEYFVIAAAEAGLFPAIDLSHCYPRILPFARVTLNWFEPQTYAIRFATLADVPTMLSMRHTGDVIIDRQQLEALICDYPEGQYVLTIEGQLQAFLLSQRLVDQDIISTDDSLGNVVSLIALCVTPAKQVFGLARILLTFVMHHATLKAGVTDVIGRISCEQISRQTYEHVVDANGIPLDADVRFFCQHGTVQKVVSDVETPGSYELVFKYHCDAIDADVSAHQVASHDAKSTQIFSIVETAVKQLLQPDQVAQYAHATSLRDLGYTSLNLLELQTLLSRKFNTDLDLAFFFRYTSVEKIAAYFESLKAAFDEPESHAVAQDSQTQNVCDTDIAVIGMSGKFPDAENLDYFWENLKEGVCSVRDVPKDRWDIEACYSENPQELNKTISRVGAFLSDIDKFDPLFFNISPVEAESIDPQQRLFLQEAWCALEDAGYTKDQLANMCCGVFVGATAGEYGEFLREKNQQNDSAAFMGLSPSILASRLSYFLNLTGPSLAIDTACSSSLVSVHLACDSLLNQQCDIALAGGVSTLLTPQMHIRTSQAGMLSPAGVPAVFDDASDGITLGEGVGVVVLKPLQKALADQDQIYGVIKATATNQDGSSNGITAPNPEAQINLIRETCHKANISAETIEYVEAHGTGTPLGDPIELSALQKAFAVDTAKRGYCAVGSVKTNIGHTTIASGIAGLIKALLALHHEKIPPHLNFQKINHLSNLADSPFYINTALLDWHRRDGAPRRAAVSAFGFSGTNAHCILQEAPIIKSHDDNMEPGQLICLSAKQKQSLMQRVIELLQWLDVNQDVSIAAVAYTLNARRTHFDYRCAFVVASVSDLQAQLQSVVLSKAFGSILNGCVKANTQLVNRHSQIQQVFAQLKKCHAVHEQEQYFFGLKMLAQWYVDGDRIDWHSFYQAQQPRLVRVPTYPFLKERYWVNSSEDFEDSVSQTVAYSLDLDASYLAEHIISGEKILPGVAYLMMVRHAVGSVHSLPDYFELRDIVWCQPVIASQLKDAILLTLDGDQACLRFQFTSEDQLYAQGEWVVGQSVAQAKPWRAIDTDASAWVNTYSQDAIYKHFERLGVDYGDTFRALQWVKTNQQNALGYYKSIVQNTTTPAYAKDVNLLDAVLQTAWILLGTSNKAGQLLLPYSLASARFYRSLPASAYVVVRSAHAVNHHEQFFYCDCQVLDETGRVCLELEGLQGSAVSQLSVLRAPALRYYERLWKKKAVGDTNCGVKTLIMVGEVVGLVDVLHQQMPGVDLILVKPGKSYRILSESCFQVRASNAEDYRALLTTLANQQRQLSHVVFASHLQSEQLFMSEHLFDQMQNLFIFMQVLSSQKMLHETRLIYLSSYQSSILSINSMLPGFAKSLVAESAIKDFRLVEVDLDSTVEQIGEMLNAECLDQQSVAHIRYVQKERLVETYTPVQLAESSAVWRKGGVYLITGGLSGIGFHIATYLAKTYQARLVITGRTLFADLKHDQVALLKSLGAKVLYLSGDVAAKSVVQQWRHMITLRYGALHGVIHCAGVVNDGLFAHKTWEQFVDVLKPKVLGAIHLDQMTSVDDLDCFILFSSMVSCFGNVGQTDYAAANAFLDQFAVWRNHLQQQGQRHGRTVAMNWPYWQEGGMSLDAKTTAYFESALQIEPIPTEQGVQAMNAMLQSTQPQLGVVYSRYLKPALLGRDSSQADTVQADLHSLDDTKLSQTIQHYIEKCLRQMLKLPKDAIGLHKRFEYYGLDSILILRLTEALEKDFGPLPKTLFFEYRTIAELTQYFEAHHGERFQSTLSIEKKQPQQTAPNEQDDGVVQPGDIAIIGVSGCYPKANDLQTLWENLANGKDCITALPEARWHDIAFVPSDEKDVRLGGFLEKIDQFDPLFFNISPREAALLDPQERLFLQTAWSVFEDAGYVPAQLSNQNVGVYVGVMYGMYQLHTADVRDASTHIANSLYASIANRVSYSFDLKGPSMAIDTMCSSSLAAIHLACESIQRGECQMALAGGVNLVSHDTKYRYLTQGQFLSSDGRCKSFGEGGDGYVPGEGVGAVLLKPLQQALADQDLIYGVIKGSAVNHNGRTNGYTVPDPNAQAAVFEAACKRAHIQPTDISYIEAHGTGTSLGDPIEIRGLVKVWGNNPDTQRCPIGSVKSNVGHLESAAGMIALTKVLLQFKYQQLVPSLHADNLNHHIPFSETPFYVQRTLHEWEKPHSNARYASISSFGAGGSNGVVILEEPPIRQRSSIKNKPFYLVTLSAKQADVLQQKQSDLLCWLQSNQDAVLEAVAYTLNVKRQHFKYRCAFVVSSLNDLMMMLQQAIQSALPGDGIISVSIDQHLRTGIDATQVDELFAQLKTSLNTQDAAYKSILYSLGKAYIAGVDLPWHRLHTAEAHQKLSLPTYPFLQKRYWVGQHHAEHHPSEKKVTEPMIELNQKLSRAIPSEKEVADIISQLKPILQKVLYLDDGHVYDLDETFIAYGMDSILSVEFIKQVNSIFKLDIQVAKLYDFASLNRLARYIAQKTVAKTDHQAVTQEKVTSVKPSKIQSVVLKPLDNQSSATQTEMPKKLSEVNQEKVAVIGMATRLPDAKSIEEFWDNLTQGKSSIREVPPSRWSTSQYYATDQAKAGTADCKWGGFIDDVDQFDPLFFNLSPLEAENMDPQQRLFLEVSWEALEDAGYSETQLNGQRCGVYAGVMNNDYKELIQRHGQEGSAQAMLGNADAILAARIAYMLNLTGPVITVDTACSSSLVTTHLACEALLRGEADLMLTGGVTLYLTETPYIQMSQTGGMLSPDGVCRPFDNQANGFVPGEGCGVVVLKRLSDAIRDGDRIYGVISGSSINQDGKSNGITAPRIESQRQLLQSVYERGKINPANISYIEAHGTGTKLGDPIEVAALTEVFQQHTDQTNYCALGSVKSNIGHTSAAAGVVGLMKLLLCLTHKKLVPSLHYQASNEHIDFAHSPFYVNTSSQPWKTQRDQHKCGAVSSFGFSGTNAHIVVEEHVPSEKLALPAKPYYLLTVSAKDEIALAERIDDLKAWVAAHPDLPLDSIAYTLTTRRSHFKNRCAFVASSVSELQTQLAAVSQQASPVGFYRGQASDDVQDAVLIEKVLHTLYIDMERPTELSDEQYQKNLIALANIYTKGYEIDFTVLYPMKNHSLISLPHYPFQRSRYWLPEQTQKKSKLDTGCGIVGKPHLFIAKNISTVHGLCFQNIFFDDEWFVQDHIVQGKTILSGAICIEMARAAGAISNPEKAVTGLRNISWLSPVVINKHTEVMLRLKSVGSTMPYDISCQQSGTSVCFQRGELLFAPHQMIPEAWESALSQSSELTTAIQREQLYQAFAEQGLEYGAAFQSIQWIKSTAASSLSYYQLFDSVTDIACVLHPCIIDAAMQSAWLLLHQKAMVPFSLDAAHIYRPFTQCGYIHVRLACDSEDDIASRYDFQICDQNNRVCAELIGLAVRPISLDGLSHTRSALHYYKPHWKAVSRNNQSFGDLPASQQKHALVLMTDCVELVLSCRVAFPSRLVIHVSSGEQYMEHDTQHYSIRLHAGDDVRTLLCSLHQQHIMTTEFAVAYDIFAIHDGRVSMQVIKTHFDVLQALLKCDEIASARMISFYSYNEAQTDWVVNSALIGMAKTLSLEHPSFAMHIVGLDAHLAFAQQIEQVTQVLQAKDDRYFHMRYAGAQQWQEHYELVSVSDASTASPIWRTHGVYLIVGGLGGVGYQIATYLAKQYCARLVIVGRTPIDAKRQSKLQCLKAQGAEVLYLSGDVADFSVAQAWIAQTKSAFGVLHGVLHCAGIYQDALFLQKDWSVFESVLRPKIQGALNLDRATQAERLDCFILFSSIASCMGNTGQSDYAIANAFLDYFAAWRQLAVKAALRFGHTVSINWPYWQDGGMQLDDALLQQVVDQLHIQPLKTPDALSALNQMLGSGLAQCGVVDAYDTSFLSFIPSQPLMQNKVPSAEKTHCDINSIQSYLRDKIACVLKLPAEKIQMDQSLESYGVDSIVMLELIRQLEKDVGLLPKTLFFEHQTLSALSQYFRQYHPSFFNRAHVAPSNLGASVNIKTTTSQFVGVSDGADASVQHGKQASPDIAIIGLAGCYPKADDLDAFWELLLHGRSAITAVPAERWNWKQYYSEQLATGKSYSRWGGFLHDVDKFDPLFFNISPRESAMMDPQERFFLKAAYHAFEDAGYTMQMLSQRKVGVFAGVMHHDYSLHQEDLRLQNAVGHVQATVWSIANRVSYYFDLVGPSLVIDTACASSLTAIHMACDSIRKGESELALAGAVNLILHPNHHIGLSQMQMLASGAKCATFSADANGFVVGEGVGVVLLKPLHQAQSDGDQIHGIIKGSAINAGGRTSGYTVPNPVRQASLIEAAIRDADVDPRTIAYIEAHGTGTALGDPIELRGLTAAFKQSRLKQCAIGSVKPNVGHLESAAGMAGLTKVLLQFKHQQLVPSIHSGELNPNINWAKTPFQVQTSASPWLGREGVPRRAGISSFGAGGSNAHLILEEAPLIPLSHQPASQPYYLILLSANHPTALQQQAKNLALYLQKHADLSIADVSYTLSARRNHFEHRIACVVPSLDILCEKLLAVENAFEIQDIYRSEHNVGQIAQQDVAWSKTLMQALQYPMTESDVHYKKQLSLLADAYVKGSSIAYKDLPCGGSQRVVSLPGYAFMEKRCWLSDDSTSQDQTGTSPITRENIAKVVLKPVADQVDYVAASDVVVAASSIEPVAVLKDLPAVSNKICVTVGDVTANLKRLLRELLFIDDEIDVTKSFHVYGMDSLLGLEFVKKINQYYGLSISAEKTYDYSSVVQLAEYVYTLLSSDCDKSSGVAHQKGQHSAPGIEQTDNYYEAHAADYDDAIAIIGMAAYLPDAKDLEAFWENLKNGVSSISEVSGERWSVEKHYAPKMAEDKTYSKWGGFVSDIDCFDGGFFEVTPIEAEYMDPQQRLFLEVSWKALEDAGCTQWVSGKRCGVYAGVLHNDYLKIIDRTVVNGPAPELKMSGNSNSLLAARIAYFLNLKGPTITLDTACSSSLVATHLACRALQTKEADLMLAGGVTLYLTEEPYVSMSNAAMLSPDGQCKVFDDKADGFVPGEGCSVLVLKRLTDALSDGDPIHAVIRNSGINQDGQTNGITAPSALSQQDLIRHVYHQKQIDASNITYVEAHGTGTKLGDPIEVQALTEAFKSFSDQKQYCAIGSVKANIGHTSAAAGATGMIKTALCLQHQQLVPSLNFDIPNKHIDFDQSPFYVNTHCKTWERKNNAPRLAAISSFGFSGTNAHVVLEESMRAIPCAMHPKPYYLVTLSAKHPDSLKQLQNNLIDWLDKPRNISIELVSYTLNAGRTHFNYRMAFVVDSLDSLLAKLLQLRTGERPAHYFEGCATLNDDTVSSADAVTQEMYDSLNIHLLDSAHYQDCLQHFAACYVAGDELNWTLLHANEVCQKISMPTYPFRQKRHWYGAYSAQAEEIPVCEAQFE